VEARDDRRERMDRARVEGMQPLIKQFRARLKHVKAGTAKAAE
jgi:hypothetical protein